MYDPPPARPKKTEFVRSRGGCAECRKRRRKCDEVKPSCNRCSRAGKVCEYGNVEVKFRDASTWAAQKVKKVRGNRVNIEANEAFFVNRRTETASGSVSFPSPAPSEEIAGPKSFHAASKSWPRQDLISADPIMSEIQWVPAVVDGTELFDFATPISLGASPHPASASDKGKEVSIYSDHPPVDSVPSSTSWDSTREIAAYSDSVSHSSEVYLNRLRKFGDIIRQDMSKHPEQGLTPRNGSIQREFVPLWGSSNPTSWNISCSPSQYNLPCQTLGFYEWMYLQHFEHLVVDILPLDSIVIRNIAKGTEIALAAAMALGAANMANLQGQFKEFWQAEEDVLWAPDHFHKVNALKLAGRALATVLQSPNQDASVLVIVNILLSFVETTLGTFDGLRSYRTLVDNMLHKVFELSSPEDSTKLVRGIADSQVFLRYVAGPWHTVSVPETESRFLAPLGSRYCSEVVGLQQIASEAVATLQRTVLIPVIQFSLRHPSTALDKLVKFRLPLLAPEYRPDRERLLSEEDLVLACQRSLGELKLLSQRLSQYTIPDTLKQSGDLGILPELYEHYDGSTWFLQGLQPLRFKTHDEAMDAADYAFAQILCDEALMWKSIQPGVSPPTGEDSSPSRNPWLRILLRIALGLDVAECIRRNIFRRGICTMLFHSVLRTGALEIMPVLTRFTQGMTARGGGWEGTEFPTKIVLQILGSVERHLKRGRRILVLSKALHRLYETSMILEYPNDDDDMIICGFERDGQFFEDYL